MPTYIAVFNAGSSSIKFAVRDADTENRLLFRDQVEMIGVAPRLQIRDPQGKALAERRWPREHFDHAAATEEIIRQSIELLGGQRVMAIGRRIVQGGSKYSTPVLINSEILSDLACFAPLAPLQQPHNLAPIRTIAEKAPHIVQVACFDTAFHHGQPHVAQSFALPRKFSDDGVHRYGFHGLSYEHVVYRLCELAPEIANSRLVIDHLGNGASLCAVREGRSVASTMGFTAVDGLMMGTRCGALDPGVIVYLMDHYGMDARAIRKLTYHQLGLLGVSGISSDMRALRESTEPAAEEAIALFVYRIIREIGSLSAALGGIDALLFTAGIGENDAATWSEIITGCGWLGFRSDNERNAHPLGRITADDSLAPAWVIPTDEEMMIAHHTM
jgi:acetate kinase